LNIIKNEDERRPRKMDRHGFMKIKEDEGRSIRRDKDEER